MTLIFIVSACVLLLGVALFIRAIRGRQISSNPHCRACKFDLTGLELNQDSICPECGKPIIPNTPTIQSGLRKRRPIIATLALVLMLLGGVGSAWPKVSQIPSIKNIDWYAKFPNSETTLLKLEANGDKDALQILHARLIPGDLSDKALQTLIVRSLAMVNDQSVQWDERWGDVLLYSFLEGKLKQSDLQTYLESAIVLSVDLDTSIDTFDTYAEYTVSASFLKRSVWSKRFWKRWHSRPQYRSNRVKVTVSDSVVLAKNPHHIHKFGDMSRQLPWDLQYISKFNLQAYIPLAMNKDHVAVRIVQEVEVEIEGKSVHSWVSDQSFVIHRQSNGRTLEQAILDSMAMERVNVYTQLDIAREHRIRYLQNIPVSLQLSNAPKYSLHGEVSLRVGERELYFGKIDWEIEENHTKNINLPNLKLHGDDPIGYYQNNQSFWEQALSVGKIDVIIRPHTGVGSKSSFTDRPIVFLDLAVEPYIPTNTPKHGNSTAWQWEPVNNFPSYPLRLPVPARFIEENINQSSPDSSIP